MEYIIVGTVFLFGLAAGSFLNAFLYRMALADGLENGPKDAETSISKGRSYCPKCGHKLSWQNLIPLVSFVLLGGKCGHCKKPVSFQYPLVELAVGLVFLLAWYLAASGEVIHTLTGLRIGYLAAVGSLLIGIFVYDLKHFIIPDKLIFSAIGLAVLWRIFEFLFALTSVEGWLEPWDFIRNFELGIRNSALFINPLASALGASFFFLSIYVLSKGRAMGFGDVKLAFFMGLFLGWPNILVALFFAFFLGAVAGVFLILQKKKGWRSQVPFGPFLVAGVLFALLFGDTLARLYLSLIGWQVYNDVIIIL
ncbi:MAG: prepilin peptidase [Candidatus Wildermuthbacteria bacterium]|nr:prepilin peptidase [Candidatus Wildermuthbacteria bacterium]